MRYKSSLDGLLTIIREEGIEGLYKGVGSKLLQSVLTAAILFMCQRRIYEITKTVRDTWISWLLRSHMILNYVHYDNLYFHCSTAGVGHRSVGEMTG